MWQGNIVRNEGKVGDVVIFDYHVAVIERVVYHHGTAQVWGYDISEWNFGPRWVNTVCRVTDKFGVRTDRRIPVSSVARIWRP